MFTPRLRLSADLNLLLISLMYRSVFTVRLPDVYQHRQTSMAR